MSAQAEMRRKAAPATVIDSPDRERVLAQHLLDPERAKPVIIITTAAGQPGPYIDVEAIVDAVSGLADVYVLPTGRVTFALSDRLPEKTQVYGGAGRVYPVDKTWQSDPYAAPLRFAFGAAEGPAATDELIADALGAVHSAGLSTKRAGATVRRVEGMVKGLPAPSRAWVRTDDGGDAAIWQDLLFPGLPIDRTFQVGMRISGALDVEERRIDVSIVAQTSRGVGRLCGRRRCALSGREARQHPGRGGALPRRVHRDVGSGSDRQSDGPADDVDVDRRSAPCPGHRSRWARWPRLEAEHTRCRGLRGDSGITKLAARWTALAPDGRGCIRDRGCGTNQNDCFVWD
jgi:hypothetical protein